MDHHHTEADRPMRPDPRPTVTITTTAAGIADLVYYADRMATEADSAAWDASYLRAGIVKTIADLHGLAGGNLDLEELDGLPPWELRDRLETAFCAVREEIDAVSDAGHLRAGIVKTIADLHTMAGVGIDLDDLDDLLPWELRVRLRSACSKAKEAFDASSSASRPPTVLRTTPKSAWLLVRLAIGHGVRAGTYDVELPLDGSPAMVELGGPLLSLHRPHVGLLSNDD